MVSLNKDTRHVSVGHLSLFLYPWPQLQQDAREGDLFVCHLVREARPLIDPDKYLVKLQSAFRFRSSYQSDIDRAVDLGMYLARFGDELNSTLLTKRALWCIRTILIARSAERRNPVFAPQRLAEETGSAAARELLTNRHIHRERAAVQQRLRSFLKEEAHLSQFLETADRDNFRERFDATSNRVALQTLRQDEDSRY
ncbi:MAG: hypothetical protein IJ127_26540 [Afipia sp.]|nr:hypothetical protein [Afipia sp.]